MCSVFYVGENMIQKMKHLTQEIDKEAEKVKLERDIHPTDQALILRWGDHKIRLSGMKWGYPVIHGSGVLINARAESVMEKGRLRRESDTIGRSFLRAIFTNGIRKRRNIHFKGKTGASSI